MTLLSRAGTAAALWVAAVLSAAVFAVLPVSVADSAPLKDVLERGALNVCAHSDALPYSSQDRVSPGFQLELGEAVARQLGVKLAVQWILFTRHARRLDCDAIMGSIVTLDDPKPRPGQRLSKPYIGSGYTLVVRPGSGPIHRLAELPGKIGVEHTSWPHYRLDVRGVKTASYGNSLEIIEAVAKGEIAAGFATDAYVGWYLKLYPGAVKVAEPYEPEPDFRWNVAISLRGADESLVGAVNRAIDTLVADGTMAQIFARYGVRYRVPFAR